MLPKQAFRYEDRLSIRTPILAAKEHLPLEQQTKFISHTGRRPVCIKVRTDNAERPLESTPKSNFGQFVGFLHGL